MATPGVSLRSWAALAALLVSGACGGGGSGVADNCGATEDALSGTWTINTLSSTLECSGQHVAIGGALEFSGVSATTTGDSIEIEAGATLTGRLDQRTCFIDFRFVDADQAAAFECACHFDPQTRGIQADCHSVSVDTNGDGNFDTSCDIENQLDADVSISG
jgi:hypothetical protein